MDYTHVPLCLARRIIPLLVVTTNAKGTTRTSGITGGILKTNPRGCNGEEGAGLERMSGSVNTQDDGIQDEEQGTVGTMEAADYHGRSRLNDLYRIQANDSWHRSGMQGPEILYTVQSQSQVITEVIRPREFLWWERHAISFFVGREKIEVIV